MKKGILISLGVFLIGIVCGIIWGVNVSNNEKRLVNRMDAQLETVDLYFDKMWKILEQKAGVTVEAKESFKEIYEPLIAGRYSNDGNVEVSGK